MVKGLTAATLALHSEAICDLAVQADVPLVFRHRDHLLQFSVTRDPRLDLPNVCSGGRRTIVVLRSPVGRTYGKSSRVCASCAGARSAASPHSRKNPPFIRA